jgi:hypothetical protein
MLQAVNVFALNASELPLALGTASRGAQALHQSLSETLIAPRAAVPGGAPAPGARRARARRRSARCGGQADRGADRDVVRAQRPRSAHRLGRDRRLPAEELPALVARTCHALRQAAKERDSIDIVRAWELG